MAEFDAPMLTNRIQVQILHPKNKRFEIDPSMKILKQMSMWISTNKKLSAEPTISKQLAEDFTQIMCLSTPKQRRKLCPNIIEEFGYQNDVAMKKFQLMCRNGGERFAAQYPRLLNSEVYQLYQRSIKKRKDIGFFEYTNTTSNKDWTQRWWTILFTLWNYL
jgi:hypothetical protein